MTADPRWRLAEARHGSLPVLLLALTPVSGVRIAGVAAAFGRILLLPAGVAAAAHTLLRRGPDWEG